MFIVNYLVINVLLAEQAKIKVDANLSMEQHLRKESEIVQARAQAQLEVFTLFISLDHYEPRHIQKIYNGYPWMSCKIRKKSTSALIKKEMFATTGNNKGGKFKFGGEYPGAAFRTQCVYFLSLFFSMSVAL